MQGYYRLRCLAELVTTRLARLSTMRPGYFATVVRQARAMGTSLTASHSSPSPLVGEGCLPAAPDAAQVEGTGRTRCPGDWLHRLRRCPRHYSRHAVSLKTFWLQRNDCYDSSGMCEG